MGCECSDPMADRVEHVREPVQITARFPDQRDGENFVAYVIRKMSECAGKPPDTQGVPHNFAERRG
jgi:hypothetical protein